MNDEKIEFTDRQMRVLAFVPQVTALASSIFLLKTVLNIGCSREKRSSMHQRLFAAICIFDLSRTLSFTIGTLAFPRHRHNTLYSLGNENSCKVQAFFIGLGMSVPLYTCILFFYLALSVRNSFKMETQQAEKWIHLLVPTFTIVVCLKTIFIDSPISLGSWCGYTASPTSATSGGFYFWITVTSAFLCALLIVYMIIIEKKRKRTRSTWNGKRQFLEVARARKASYTIKQSALYLSVLVFSNSLMLITDFSDSCFGQIFTSNLLMSLNGLLNFVVYSKILIAPAAESDFSSFRLREACPAKLSIVSHGFNPSTEIGSTIGKLFNYEEHDNPADFAIFMGHDDEEENDLEVTIPATSGTEQRYLSGFSELELKSDDSDAEDALNQTHSP